jgi:murein L,D-transpeptidase YafK
LLSAHTHHPRRSSGGRRFPTVLAAFLWLTTVAAGPSAAADYEDITYDPARYHPEKPLAAILQETGLAPAQPDSIPNPRLEIEKSTYELRLYSGDLLLKTYRIQLGKRPRGAKTRRYDSRTPVGSYRICGHNRNSRYYLSLQLTYPNEEDIARALAEKRISSPVAQTLRKELAAGDCPGGRTRLGGEIFIHGQFPKVTRQLRQQKRRPSSRTDLQSGDLDPGQMKEWYNWTSGCIGMANPDIRELYKYLPDGTPVKISE